jgi:hypothetical protein
MREHSVRLNDNEFKLFQSIQRINIRTEVKNDLIESLLRQVKHFYKLTSHKNKQNWLQVGDRTLFENIDPVKPEEDSPLASSIIVEQRKRLNVL